MELHPEDLRLARSWQEARLTPFPALTASQREALQSRARGWLRSSTEHPLAHSVSGLLLLAGLFAVDLWTLLVLPGLLGASSGRLRDRVIASVAAGALHGFLVCSLVTFSVHEGAAHNRIVFGSGRAARFLRALANNACRLFYADPEHYRAAHASHHRALGGSGDGSFTSYVRPARLAQALVPLAPVRSASDFFPWRPQAYTPSRRFTALLSKLWLAALFAAVWLRFGPTVAVVSVLLIGSWLSFVLDRLRESVEHLFMPLDPINGTRELGLGLWGLLLGGGPWGQPCHLSHHLAPALPWYWQLRLHFELRRLLTPAQRRAFFLRPIVGLPKLWWEWLAFARARAAEVRQ